MIIKRSQWNSDVKDFLNALCTEDEKHSEAQLHAKTSISGCDGGGSSKKARTTVTPVALSGEDDALAELGYSAQPKCSITVAAEIYQLHEIDFSRRK